MIFRRWRLLALALAALSAASAPAQVLPPGVRSTEKFAGEVTLSSGGAAAAALATGGNSASMPVDLRELAISPGARIDDLRFGGRGVLVVELRIGSLRTEIDGNEQVRRPGEFFVVPADQKISAATVGDRSAILATLLLPTR
jgi:hypothetical protein